MSEELIVLFQLPPLWTLYF